MATSTPLNTEHSSRALLPAAILTFIYVLLGLVLPPNTPTLQTYHLSVTEYHVLLLLLNIPIAVVWTAAFYGYAKVQEYGLLIKKTAHGKAFLKIGTALKWLAWGLPVSAITSSLLAGLVHAYPGLLNTAIIIGHYIPVIISIVAFTHMSKGSRGLADITRSRPSLRAIRTILMGFAAIAISYCYFAIEGTKDNPNPYRLPLWLILFTIVLPYLYAWFMGLVATYEIFLYSHHSKGLLYQKALSFLSGGIVMAIFSSIILQYIASDTTHVRRITFNALFLFVYAVLLVYAGGFVLTALGAKKLKKIEEV